MSKASACTPVRPTLLAGLLLLLPLAAADPTGSTGPVFEGMASQGSVDQAADWSDEPRVCSDAITRIVATLTILSGSPGDVVRIEAGFGNAPAEARLGRPATAAGLNPNGCAEFVVTGVDVEGEARYAVTASVLTGAFAEALGYL